MKLYRDFSSQEQIDSEYKVADMVPDIQSYLEGWAKASEKARNEMECELDMRYGPTLDETVDVFPAGQSGSPILIFIHGGYWHRLGSKDFSYLAAGPVSHGVTVVVTSYSLCPKVTIAEITRQSRAVVAWLQDKADEFNGDPSRIFACGHSAGGQQVGMLAATDWPGEYGLPQDVIKGGVSISGVFDLSPLRYSWLQPKLLLTHEIIARQSPLFHIPAVGPPLLISVGDEESGEFHRQSKKHLEAWRERGLQGELLIQPKKNHFSAIDGLAEADSAFCSAVIEFMERCEKQRLLR